jgi:Tol biopolymer transport system component
MGQTREGRGTMRIVRLAFAAFALTFGLYPTAARATYPGGNGLIVLNGTIGGSDSQFVYVVNSDGSNRRALAPGEGSPRWTADGQRIYFRGGPDCPYPTYVCAIYSVSVDGTGLRKQTWPGSGQFDDDPYPLPGGGFVFARLSDVFSFPHFADIWVKLPGQRAKRLTWTRKVDESSPAVSPDGTRIAYLGRSTGGSFLFIMNRDGTGKRKLAPASEGGGVDFSPDGTRLVFGQFLDPVWGGPPEGVYFYDLQTDTVSRVGSLHSTEPGWDALSFSPDGTRLLITEATGDGNYLFSTDLTGGDMHGINPVSGDDPEQDWYFSAGYWQPVP